MRARRRKRDNAVFDQGPGQSNEYNYGLLRTLDLLRIVAEIAKWQETNSELARRLRTLTQTRPIRQLCNVEHTSARAAAVPMAGWPIQTRRTESNLKRPQDEELA